MQQRPRVSNLKVSLYMERIWTIKIKMDSQAMMKQSEKASSDEIGIHCFTNTSQSEALL